MTCLALLFFGTACSVHHAPLDTSKLDPAFAALISRQKGNNQSVYPNLPVPTEGKATKDAPTEKGYDCIVYTKQAAALRKKGIKIYSELPDFVTAWATLRQIELMASMDEVRYIEAPKTNYPTQQAHTP